jgi:hypothetical protein
MPKQMPTTDPRAPILPERPTNGPSEPREPGTGGLSDSPWFWVLAFSLMGLIGLAGIAGKYDRRQAQIEGRYLGRETLAAERARRAAGLAAEDLAEAAEDPAMRPGERLIPLWPVALALGGIASAAGWMLLRERSGRRVVSR